MKYCLIMLIATGISISAMENQLQLTEKEQACYNWFVETQKGLPSTVLQLSDEDREIFKQQIKFKDNPGAVIRSRNNFAAAFYAKAKAVNPENDLPYEETFVKATFVKMAQIMGSTGIQNPKTYTETCMWAWQQLKEEEQKKFSEDAYNNNPDATKTVADKLTDQICDKLIELKLLTSQERAAKKKELYEERVARFEKQYKNK